MQHIEYIGEHLFFGKIGNAFVLLSLVFAILVIVSYYFTSKSNYQQKSWLTNPMLQHGGNNSKKAIGL